MAIDKPTDPAPRSATPIVVAVLSLSGVLGASLLANWDKIFSKPAAKAVTAATPAVGAQSPVLTGVSGPVTINYGAGPAPAAAAAVELASARLAGVWLSPSSTHPYQPDRRFRLRLELRPFGGGLTGQVSDIPEGQAAGNATELPTLKPEAEGIDFQVEARWCCEDGKERPYQVFYQVRFEPNGLAVTRRNNAPGGGKVERFLLSRG